MSEEMIEPCPFCAKAVAPEFYDRGERSSYWYVSCNGEEGEHQVRAVGNTEAEAIAAWNTRAYNPNERLREALEECADKLWVIHFGLKDKAEREAVINACNMATSALSPLPQGEDT